jgi:hypothetical protein
MKSKKEIKNKIRKLKRKRKAWEIGTSPYYEFDNQIRALQWVLIC